METVDAAPQTVAGPVILTWEDVYRRVAALPIPRSAKVYGVPRGGAIVAGLLGLAVDTPDAADYLVDDIVDSGQTMARYTQQFAKPFFTLVDKPGEGLQGRWVQFPWEGSALGGIEDAITRQLQHIGEDPLRDGLRDTPARVVRSWRELFSGYALNPEAILAKRFPANHHELVILKGLEFYSTCEHHWLPFVGRAHIGYIPAGEVVGISKLARLLECYARRLQIQEQLCRQVVEALMTHVKPAGAACILEAQHFCMTSRGVSKQESTMVTSAVRGVFETDVNARQEFLRLIGQGG